MISASRFNTRTFSCLLICLTLFSAKAKAAVIYIDFNNNPEERQMLLKSARAYAPHEQMVLVPTEDPRDALALQQLTSARDQVWDVYTKKSCSADLACQAVPSGECKDIYIRLKAYEDAAWNAPKTPLNEDTIRSALKGLSTSLTNVNEPITLILSGHFGGGVFTGNLGSLSVADLKRIFNDFPALQARISSLYLLGCYTNTYPQIQSLWRDAFPKVRVLAGFHSQSPKGESAKNLSFINTLIRNSRNFDQVQTQTQFERALMSLQPYRDINVALSIDDFYQKTGDRQLFKVSDGQQKALSCHAVLSNSDLDYFQSIQNGNLPVPTTNDSRLRQYYTALRNHASCLDEADFLTLEPTVPNPDQVIRLILYKTVVANFRNLQGSDMANFDMLLKGLGVEPALMSQAVNFDNRLALITWIKALQVRLGKVSDHDAASKVLDLVKGLSDTLVDLRNNCVPFSWVEPGASEVSSCFRAAGQCGG